MKEGWLDSKLRDQLHRLQKKFFGFGREKLKKKTRQVGHKQQKLNIHGKRSLADERTQEEQKNGVKTQGKSGLVKEHDFTEEELGEETQIRGLIVGEAPAWSKMKGLYQESTEITVTERVYQKVIHRQAKYRLNDEYNNTGKEVIITAPGPAKVKPGCKYSIDFAVAAVTDKFQYHTPLERQRRKMEEAGLEVGVKTLYRLTEAVAEHCNTIIPAIKKEIMDEFCAIHLDESPWRLFDNEKTGYMWVMSNRIGSYFQFEPTRSGAVPDEMLKGYQGAVVVDAYSGYNPLRKNPDIRVGHCWSHVRREFFERIDDFEEDCTGAVNLIDELFDIEAKAKDFDELKKLRLTESRPLTMVFRDWCFEARFKYLPEDGITKAINYTLNHWKELTLFTRDLSVPLSNNEAERSIRQPVMGRKNFNGSKTINGADTAASLYTIIETCKKSSIHPAEYIKYVVEERWYKRFPLTPRQYGIQIKGLKPNDEIKWPDKSDWEI